ncbi:DegT/DnrJ/EryC1/StrS aminotransferase family protein [Thioalkalivibrio sp. XN279]|uniref:DegT/DnrJ/EryC1/StrS family aminotransferase n=1 Tax=Thioalkalivibrio sp. XN279 TaxID=2714953 RepID=UPI001407A8D0|nr:DegT/DnrJ/EryC1/StrS family aminotransferase [Thioalkalivibrio sp. XN279]NHA15457.1 DegT/DnrJ/EryC1/StrS family aminotransferase [Thioalkalivibrio sp. XN279]
MIPLVKVAMPPRESLLSALEEVLYSGFIGEGEHVYHFEKCFAETFGLPIALGVSSGTAALHLAILLADVKPGDEVITTSMTAEPTNVVILQCGAVPVFADVEPDTGNLDPASVESLIGPRTRAIVVVHYAGFPAPLAALRTLADRHDIVLIEDAAHSLGATYGGQGIGTVGDFAIFSFQAIKHMTTIDGGMLTMRDLGKVELARRLRWFGLAKGVPRTEVDITRYGFKYNMHNVAAVIGLAQLKWIRSLIDRHIANGRFFDECIPKIAGLSITRFEPTAAPSYWLYSVLSDDSEGVERRLAAVDVAASKLHRPNHLHSVFAAMRRPLPGLDTFYRRLTHLPCGWWVTDADRERIIDALSKG